MRPYRPRCLTYHAEAIHSTAVLLIIADIVAVQGTTPDPTAYEHRKCHLDKGGKQARSYRLTFLREVLSPFTSLLYIYEVLSTFTRCIVELHMADPAAGFQPQENGLHHTASGNRKRAPRRRHQNAPMSSFQPGEPSMVACMSVANSSREGTGYNTFVDVLSTYKDNGITALDIINHHI